MEKLKSQIIEEQIEALINKGKGLRESERIFLKASGITESIEQYRVEIANTEATIESKKEDLAELKAMKSDAVKDTLISIQDKITELLPEGDGVVHINDDGSFIIGWMLPNKSPVPYEGLSGGQKVIFGRALTNALMGNAKNKILVYEAAEVDPPNLQLMLERIVANTDNNTQVIVNTWLKTDVPKGWNLIEFPLKI